MHGTLGHARRIFLTTDAVGGIWRYSLAIAAGFAARDWHCTIAVMGPAPSKAQQLEVASIPRCSLLDTGLPLDWTAQNALELTMATRCLQTLARQSSAETAHLHTPSLAAIPWPIPTVAVAHSCVGTWWHALYDPPPPLDFQWRMEVMREGLQAAAAVIAPSQVAATALRNIYCADRQIDVVHNGLASSQSQRLVRARRVVTAARLWDRGKNVAVLDKAAVLLNAPIEAAGPTSGPDGAHLSFNALTLLGNLSPSRLRTAMASAAIFAAPSVYEPFGLAVLEAAQLGTPLVLADNATFRELWTGAAVFVDPHDHVAWATTLRTVLDAPDYCAELGIHALSRSKMYSAKAMVASTLAIHRAVAMQPV